MQTTLRTMAWHAWLWFQSICDRNQRPTTTPTITSTMARSTGLAGSDSIHVLRLSSFLSPSGQQVKDADKVILAHLHEHLLVEPIQFCPIGDPGLGEGCTHLKLEGLEELKEDTEVLVH